MDLQTFLIKLKASFTSKAGIASYLTMVVSILVWCQQDQDVARFLATHPKLVAEIGTALGLLHLAIRFITNGPLGSKVPEDPNSPKGP